MAITALDVAWAGWVITGVGWVLSPVITLFLPKIIPRLGFDASQKLWDLEFVIIPELENTLRTVDQERMMERGKRNKSDVAKLDKMAASLRWAREDAKDIFDDAQEIQLYRFSWQHLYSVTKAFLKPFIVLGYSFMEACFTRCLRFLKEKLDELKEKLGPGLGGVVATCKSSFMWLLLWARKIFSLCPLRGRSEEPPLPVTTSSVAPSDQAAVATSDGPQVPVAAPSNSTGWWLYCWCSFVDFIEKWVGITAGFACSQRDFAYEGAGITGFQGKATLVDFVLTTIVRSQLKKNIDNVRSIINNVKVSPLLVKVSKISPDDIANQNRRGIRTASCRKVFGREALRDSIMARLRETAHSDASSSSTSTCYSVIGIYGVAGSGKTTFASYIRDFIEKECMEDKLFDTIMCIHVSETFSVKDIFHEMLKDITKDQHSNISNREELEDKLKESLHGKRFFLILDDIWVKNKNDPQLEELISPLNVGLTGSKILVTTRTKVTARALCADEPTQMPDLDADQYLSMFMHYALGDTSVIGEEFKQVGRLIAEKLHGSPIAAVIVAGRLGANRDIRFWKKIAEQDMFNDTMDTLWWSYQQLSSDIKRCFEYCNVFPRRYILERGELVHLWIAQGFITCCARDNLEDVAEGYIQELASCSFLQLESTWNGKEFFRIHDLLHDLADMVTGTDCFKIENESGQRGESWNRDIPQRVHHLFIQNYDAKLITKEILGLRNLLTLIIYVVGKDKEVEEKIIENICKKLPKLRVLSLALSPEYIPMDEHKKWSVPESLGRLKHLRYFSVRTEIRWKISLPSTLNKLQHIQILDFGEGTIFDFNFAELVNLRHILCASDVTLPYIGRLSSLQKLPCFEVRNEQGYELKQLRDLNKLRGQLIISGLEKVKSKEQALEANLNAKEFLTILSLLWGFDNDPRCSREVQSDVLEGLCPPAGLKTLELLYFTGYRYPDWMLGEHSGGPKCLQELFLCGCSQPVPASGLAEAFPHLSVLELWSCSWDTLPANMEHLKSLKELQILSCKNIRSLPSLPQSLEQFLLDSCSDQLMKSCQTTGHPNWKKIEHIPNKRFE